MIYCPVYNFYVIQNEECSRCKYYKKNIDSCLAEDDCSYCGLPLFIHKKLCKE